MTRALVLALSLLVFAPSLARADGPRLTDRGGDLSAPREGSTHRRRHRRHRRPGPPAPPYEVTGPHVQLGYTHYWLPIARSPGDVNVGTLSGFFSTRDIRAGVTFEGGSRNYHLGNDDILARGQLFVGWQSLHVVPGQWFVPWVTGNLGLGFVLGQRLSTALAWMTWSVGGEVGADLYFARSFHVGVAVGAAYYGLGDIGYPVIELRAYFGL